MFPSMDPVTERIDALVDELGIEPVTEASFRRDRARLAKKFFVVYGVHEMEIDDLIRANELPEDEMVQDWIELHAVEPYVCRKAKPPDLPRETATQNESRESGFFVFGRKCRVARLVPILRPWTRSTQDSSRGPSGCLNLSRLASWHVWLH